MIGLRAAILAAVVVSVGALSVAWGQLPPGAQIGPGGVLAELSVPDAEGGIWRLRVYRAGRSSLTHRPRGEIDLCLAVDKGGKRWHGIVCELTAAMALALNRRGVKADCGYGGLVVGEPAPPSPTCGLVPADVQSVTVSADGFPPQAAVLSEPFQIRVNRSERILDRTRVDPELVRALPPVLTVRAYLAFVNTPPTEPGERTPRITVTATRGDGTTASRTRGGQRIPASAPDPPPLEPPAGAPRVHLSATGTDSRVWNTTSWRNPDGTACARLRVGNRRRGFAALGCFGRRNLAGQLAKLGSAGYTSSGPGPRTGYAAYGFTHGDAVAVTVVDRRGRLRSARLSAPWTSVRRGGHVLRVRSFLAALPGRRPTPRPRSPGGVEVRTTLADGRVLSHKL